MKILKCAALHIYRNNFFSLKDSKEGEKELKNLTKKLGKLVGNI